MTERTHIQRYYRQRFAELHTRNLRVNSHRKQMGDWRLAYRLHDNGRFVIAMVRDGFDQMEYEVPTTLMNSVVAGMEAELWSTKHGGDEIGIDFWMAGASQ